MYHPLSLKKYVQILLAGTETFCDLCDITFWLKSDSASVFVKTTHASGVPAVYAAEMLNTERKNRYDKKELGLFHASSRQLDLYIVWLNDTTIMKRF